MLNDVELLAFVLGSLVMKVSNKRIPNAELLEFILTDSQKYSSPEKISAAADYALNHSGAFIILGDEITLSERGRVMLNISTKKLAVADLVGDNFTSLSKEEIEKIKDASDSVPG